MTISQAMCTSAKAEFFGGIHDLDTDVIKIALYESTADLSAATTAYTTTGEVVGTNYSAGGATLTGAAISSSGTTAFVTFADPIWPSTTVTARGALLYNSSKANRALAVLDFGADKTGTATTTFTITMPAAAASTALLRIA